LLLHEFANLESVAENECSAATSIPQKAVLKKPFAIVKMLCVSNLIQIEERWKAERESAWFAKIAAEIIQ
tara:strand:+ start:7762 stop:7971 length:210 start_codon:yes stop_codon:yes gene_type:complete